MLNLLNCNTGTLVPYVPNAQNPWNIEKVTHLFRRMSFGGTNSEISDALDNNPSALVDNLITTAIAIPPMTTLAEMGSNDLRLRAITDFGNYGLRGSLALFWHGHFATQLSGYNCNSYMTEYYELLFNHGLGNFKELTKLMSKSNAMLRYMNSFTNTKDDYDQNHARNLFEIHTLGLDQGYTDQDVYNASRAMTGYNERSSNCGNISFDPLSFDATEKTVFGQTGNWNFDDIIDILFAQRGDFIARYICEKIYANYVSPNINYDIVDELAALFVVDFDIQNLLRVLFKSEHFFDKQAMGTIIKSPVDLIVGLIKTTNPTIDAETNQKIVYNLSTQEQILFAPPTSSGWPGDVAWIDAFFMRMRRTEIRGTIRNFFDNNTENFRSFVIFVSNNSNNPETVVRRVVDFLIPRGIFYEEDYERILTSFKRNVPEEDFENGSWNLNSPTASEQIEQLFLAIANQPEFQLK